LNYIDLNTSLSELSSLLKKLSWISDEKIVKIESPGAGNMNVVVRVITDKRTFILKQSRPFVQKYPQVLAPIERIDTEYQFYKTIDHRGQARHFPKILNYAPENHLIMMDDLGNCEDLTSIYQNRFIKPSLLNKLVVVLSSIHKSQPTGTYPDNMPLRLLNHEHIFVLPFLDDNGFDLETVQIGLSSLADRIKSDPLIKSIVASVGSLYLSDGDSLIHGDYYPGSWMAIEGDVVVLDPEFSFMGFREFDLGVMLGHLIMAYGDDSALASIIDQYAEPIDKQLMRQVAGIEIVRRILGLAQLPLSRTIEEKKTLLDIATQLILK
jgi:5-methylthioribose kinase